jgi:hypothetical protein
LAHEELNEIRKMTRRGYEDSMAEETKLAAQAKSADDEHRERIIEDSARLGYGEKDTALLPPQSTVDEGAGNPLGAIEVKPGDAIMVIGCRTGADCFLAAKATGKTGKVIGVE